MNRHELKVWPNFFAALLDGSKTFELRRDDRTPRFEVGDELFLREYVPPRLGDDNYGCLSHFGGEYTERELRMRVTYVARDNEIIPKGYCCMSVAATPEAGPTDAPSDDVLNAAVKAVHDLLDYADEVRNDWSDFDGRQNRHRIQGLLKPLSDAIDAAIGVSKTTGLRNSFPENDNG